ncbi:hypothetical protein [Paraliobacillus sediminis]|uniref:hypothetical protein n=1 Tax=Paraliobacillus sediminis TaxID=1885916 RepID=UPI000E3EAD41|nr:hypothetical protein [Paraliobacillus sediminis]
MLLPIIDVGLMNEHLSTHEGLLGKLDLYLIDSSATYLQKIITIQQTVLKSHIQVMLELLNPSNENWIELPSINLEEKLSISWPVYSDFDTLTKRITLELQSAAKAMAHTNFTSALMMKNENVKHVHYEMAVQQATYMNYISAFVKEKDWAPSIKASQVTQRKVIEHFNSLI